RPPGQILALHPQVVEIAAKQLVTAIAAESDDGLPTDQPRNQIRRNHRRVGHRLVELTGEERKKIDRRRLDGKLCMVGCEVLRDQTREWRFVLLFMPGE